MTHTLNPSSACSDGACEVLTTTFLDTHILCATITREGSLNAINFDVMGALESVLLTLEPGGVHEHVRVFILRGAGRRAFISGGDLRAFATLKTEEDARQMAERMRAVLSRIELLNCWTIACVNGDAYGGGCETMLVFDQRVAREGVRLGWTQARFYLPPGWGGLTRLTERVGRPTALRWLGQASVVSCTEALDAKLLDDVFPKEELESQTLALAKDLAKQDRILISALKKGAMRAQHPDARQASIDAELDAFAICWAKEEHMQRVQAWLARHTDV